MQGIMMKKPVFILVVGDDLSDYSDLISRIQHLGTERNFYKASESLHFIDTLSTVENITLSVLQTEIRVIIDLDLPFFEAYVCLQALAAYDYKCPVRVYLLENEGSIKACPSIDQYIISGRFYKPLKTPDIERIIADCTTAYFQKEGDYSPDAFLNKSC